MMNAQAGKARSTANRWEMADRTVNPQGAAKPAKAAPLLAGSVFLWRRGRLPTTLSF